MHPPVPPFSYIRRAPRSFPFLLSLLLVSFAAAQQPPAAPSAEPTNTPTLWKQISDLAKLDANDDPTVVLQAIRGLDQLGEPAKAELSRALRRVLNRDQAALAALIRKHQDPAELRTKIETLSNQQKIALENIKVLKKAPDETMLTARAYHSSLAKQTEDIHKAIIPRVDAAVALARRAELLAIWQRIAPPNDAAFPADKEEQLASDALLAIGAALPELQSAMQASDSKPPADPLLRAIWHYRFCRATEAHNARYKDQMHAEEWSNLTILNRYRESLGILPYELDPRLIQAARRHSREMVDLKYFSHTSPTPENKSHTQRMSNAGYRGGYGENIAAGTTSGDGVFWMWFESPGHHQNMATPSATQIGIGKWRSTWTQNMGRGKRLLYSTPEQLATAQTVQGEMLAPDPSAAAPSRSGSQVPEKYRPKPPPNPRGR